MIIGRDASKAVIFRSDHVSRTGRQIHLLHATKWKRKSGLIQGSGRPLYVLYLVLIPKRLVSRAGTDTHERREPDQSCRSTAMSIVRRAERVPPRDAEIYLINMLIETCPERFCCELKLYTRYIRAEHHTDGAAGAMFYGFSMHPHRFGAVLTHGKQRASQVMEMTSDSIVTIFSTS